MSESRCAACGEQTVYEEELGSAVCTSCGTLANPAQSVLASHLERVDVSGHDYLHYPATSTSAGATLKGRNGWSLAGQDKAARDRRNKVRPFISLYLCGGGPAAIDIDEDLMQTLNIGRDARIHQDPRW